MAKQNPPARTPRQKQLILVSVAALNVVIMGVAVFIFQLSSTTGTDEQLSKLYEGREAWQSQNLNSYRAVVIVSEPPRAEARSEITVIDGRIAEFEIRCLLPDTDCNRNAFSPENFRVSGLYQMGLRRAMQVGDDAVFSIVIDEIYHYPVQFSVARPGSLNRTSTWTVVSFQPLE